MGSWRTAVVRRRMTDGAGESGGARATDAALDGGATSPLCLLLFIALSYSALAYPPRAVLAFTTLAVGVYLGLALGSAATGAFVQLSASMLGLCGVLGAFAAANQWRQRAA